ncbi:MAG: serine hydrolase [Marinifilaceae bacterium]
MRNIFTLVFLLFLFNQGIYAQEGNIDNKDRRLKNLDKDLTQVLSDFKVAGFAVAIVEKDQVIYSNGFGYRDYDRKIPVDANTLFPIGSCSKSFTAAIIGNLEGKGRLSLNDSPLSYLPEMKFYNQEMNNQVNLRDMMSHRTGLPRHDLSWYLFPTDSSVELLKRVEYLEPTAGIREKWQYNNFMYMAQGLIAKSITGKSWAENVKEQFFIPLKMERSNTTIEDLEKDENHSFGYGVNDEKDIRLIPYRPIVAMAPAGAINSSVNEMAKWLKVWINNGKLKEKEVLSSSYLQEAISSQMIISNGLPSKKHPDMQFSTYGFGWMLSSYRGHYRVEHGGNIDGFSANSCFFPGDSIGIVVLTNQDASPVPGIVRNIIADKVLGLSCFDWAKGPRERMNKLNSEDQDQISDRVTGTHISHELKEFTGVYSNPGYGDLEIVVENDSLFALIPNKRIWLKHFHYDVFEPMLLKESDPGVLSEFGVKFNFQSNNAGEISKVMLPLELSLKSLEFVRKPKVKEVSVATLEKFVGEYEVSGMILKCYIKYGKSLFISTAGQPEQELVATEDDTFLVKNVDGFKLKFLSSDKSTIDAVNLIQPNGTFKAKRKS